MDDLPNIPTFLIIPSALRAAAWVKSPPRPWPKFEQVRRDEEPATKALREELAYQDSARVAREGQRLRALSEEKAAEKAELKAVASRAAQAAPRVAEAHPKRKRVTRTKQNK